MNYNFLYTNISYNIIFYDIKIDLFTKYLYFTDIRNDK